MPRFTGGTKNFEPMRDTFSLLDMRSNPKLLCLIVLGGNLQPNQLFLRSNFRFSVISFRLSRDVTVRDADFSSPASA